jgi:hypothetical protein
MTSVNLDRIEYWDEFCEDFSSGRDLSMNDVLQASTRVSSPAWLTFLFWLRDSVVQWFGLKTAREIKRSSDKFGIFTVLEKKEDEIVAGEDDRHLNFRVIFRLTKTTEHLHRLSFKTLVQFNNRLGRIYFIPVKPVHKIIVPLLLRRLVREVLSDPAQE